MTDTSADPERNRLTGRLTRTAKVGANLSGAGLTFAAQSLFGGDQGDEKIAKALAAALGKSKGPLMKVAQMLSTAQSWAETGRAGSQTSATRPPTPPPSARSMPRRCMTAARSPASCNIRTWPAPWRAMSAS